jgi:3-isopropylmalate/(R)-2-methylmalate dehydratase large subunit
MSYETLQPKEAEAFTAKRPEESTENNNIHFDSVLYLTADPNLFKAQLKCESPHVSPQIALLDEVSTDQIITVGDLLTDDMNELGRRALLGLEDSYGLQKGTLVSDKKRILVAGERFGRGSSREQAVWALKSAGIGAVAAKSFGPIFEKNAANIGLLTTTNLDFLASFDPQKPIDKEIFLRGKDILTRSIVQAGGLLPYLQGINKKIYIFPGTEDKERRQNRPMTIIEKRIAKAINNASIKAGESVLLPVNIAYSYVGLSGLARQSIIEKYGHVEGTLPAENIFFHEDHFAHSKRPQIGELTQNQRNFAEELNVPQDHYFKGKLSENGGKGICHRVMLEKINPSISQTVIATDSHTPTIGVLPILGLPVGSTLFAAGIAESKIPFSVPSTTRVELSGKIPPGYSIRDVQFELAAMAKQQKESSAVEFGGSGFNSLSFDQVAALCNMVPEIFNGEIAVTEIFEDAIKVLKEQFGISEKKAHNLYMKPDKDVVYDRVINFDMNKTTAWVALPGSPNNTTSLRNFRNGAPLQKAFLASCTLGLQDLKEAAAAIKGKSVNSKTQLIVIPSSENIRRQAEANGYLQILRNAGANVVDESACGPCIGEGLGAVEDNEIAISASNRNFTGRMGAKSAKVYLAGSILTALSSAFGRIPTAEEYMSELPGIVENLRKFDLKNL